MVHGKELKVSAIENGTVIDHIPTDNLFKVIKILDLDKTTKQVTFGANLDSKKLGRKAIIKISEVFFEDHEINKISLVAPQARLNVIKNYKVVEKRDVTIPDTIVGIVKCFNPQCITNNEMVTTRFKVINKKEVAMRCHYCEKITTQEELKFVNS
ncbi:aspartate carbamoyltransferase regulatory subunit [Thermophagus sp. OGC60D27]|uniref:aspartate carbamoyltransferase regulatory subunit n=1 Tax=Thermophagus sp. OGC60D27 TaxID=3458415 RepID=UPI0040376EC4